MKIILLSSIALCLCVPAVSYSDMRTCDLAESKFDACYAINEKKIEKFIDKKYDACRFKCFKKTYKTWKTCTREESDELQSDCDDKCGAIEWSVPYCAKERKNYKKCNG